jgi:hypothetical protein
VNLSLSPDRARQVCLYLLSAPRAELLLGQWSRAYPAPDQIAAEVLVIAAVIARGAQEPSAATSLSAAGGLQPRGAGQALLLAGLACAALEAPAPLSDPIRALAAEGLACACHTLIQTLSAKEHAT